MHYLRTPDERFAALPDFPYAPRFVDVGGVRMAWVEAGPADGPVVLCLHGEPTWSFLYRKLLPVFAAAGLRAVAADLSGFGRSDKPAAREDYSYQAHLDWLRRFLESQQFTGITLVCQDWGGLLGLRLATELPERFARLVAANTFLPTGDQPMPKAFFKWRDFWQSTPDFDVASIVARGCVTPLPPLFFRMGINVPIVPGIMPITNDEQVQRFVRMCGATVPMRLQLALEKIKDDAAAVMQLGVAHATVQCMELLSRGVPGIHFYTLNKSPASRMIVSALRGSSVAAG